MFKWLNKSCPIWAVILIVIIVSWILILPMKKVLTALSDKGIIVRDGKAVLIVQFDAVPILPEIEKIDKEIKK